jgi:hypothetical protein
MSSDFSWRRKVQHEHLGKMSERGERERQRVDEEGLTAGLTPSLTMDVSDGLLAWPSACCPSVSNSCPVCCLRLNFKTFAKYIVQTSDNQHSAVSRPSLLTNFSCM